MKKGYLLELMLLVIRLVKIKMLRLQMCMTPRQLSRRSQLITLKILIRFCLRHENAAAALVQGRAQTRRVPSQ